MQVSCKQHNIVTYCNVLQTAAMSNSFGMNDHHKDALFLESNDDACCSLQAAFPCHLPKRRTLPFYNNTNVLNAFRIFELKCPILKKAFQASFILVALLYAHYNVLFEVLKNCLSLRQNIKRKFLNDMLQYNCSPAVLFAGI